MSEIAIYREPRVSADTNRPDVMHNHVSVHPALLLIHNNANVPNASTQIPGHQIARNIIRCPTRNWKRFSISLKEDHEVGYPPMINVGIRTVEPPASLIRVSGEIAKHVFVNFLLQIDEPTARFSPSEPQTILPTWCWHAIWRRT